MTDGYPIGMGEAEPEKVREGGRWSDIMAAPLDDDALYRPLEFEVVAHSPGEGVIDLTPSDD